jgi:hypothetical protein
MVAMVAINCVVQDIFAGVRVGALKKLENGSAASAKALVCVRRAGVEGVAVQRRVSGHDKPAGSAARCQRASTRNPQNTDKAL